MKVKIEVIVNVDPVKWAETAGCDRAEVRNDIKSYVAAYIHSGLPMLIDEADGKVEVR